MKQNKNDFYEQKYKLFKESKAISSDQICFKNRGFASFVAADAST